MSPLQKKILFWALNIVGIIGLLLIIILTPIMTKEVWANDNVDAHALEIVIMVMIPFLISTNCFVLAQHFACYNYETALGQLEKQFKNHTIDMEKYKAMYKHIIDFEMEKRTLKAKVEAERINNKKQVQKKIQSAKREVLEN